MQKIWIGFYLVEDKIKMVVTDQGDLLNENCFLFRPIELDVNSIQIDVGNRTCSFFPVERD